MDEPSLECEPAGDAVDRDALRRHLERHLHEGLGVRIAVSLLEPGSVPGWARPVQVVDRRR